MRSPRWKASPDDPAGYYHCISRVVERQFHFQERERHRFRQLLSEYSAFCGIRVVSWCILSNHFHLLIQVPQKPPTPPPVEELVQRLEHLSSTFLTAAAARQLLQLWAEQGNTTSPEQLRNRLWAQMYDLSQFMKLLKQRFSQWFNRVHERKGTLWEERFRSVLVEANSTALATVAAYIDLNCVRAGLATDPKDYRWCGYAEAVAGNSEARKGLAEAIDCPVDQVLETYRQWLFGLGEEREGTDEAGRPLKKGFDRAQVLQVLAKKGRLDRSEYLRLRIRYLVDGAVLGSKEFVNDAFQRHRDRFGPKRTSGARPVQGLPSPGLCCLRALRLKAVG